MRPSVTLSRHRDAIIAIIRRHRADNPRLFGSTARGQDSEASDLDLLIDPAPGMTLFDLGAIIDELENLLGVAVDVVTPGALPPAIAKSILQDIRPL
jgi:predicted nucleotidyltransferase